LQYPAIPVELPQDWRDRALSVESADDCLELLLRAAEAQFGSQKALIYAPAWGGLRPARGDQSRWTAVLGQLAMESDKGPLFIESRESLMQLIRDATLAPEPGALAVIRPPVRSHAACTLALAFEDARTFADSDRTALRTFAQQAVPVLERAGLLFDLQRQQRVWRLVADVGAALHSSLDYEATLERAVRLMVPEFADCAAIDLVRDGKFERVAVAAADPVKDALAQQLKQRRYVPTARVPWGASNVIAAGKPQLIRELDDEIVRGLARDELHLAIMRKMGARSYVCVPLLVDEAPIGALSLASSLRPYDERDLEIGIELARRTAVAIENARLYTLERRASLRLRKLQEATVALAGARTPDDIARVVTRLGSEAVGAVASFMWIRNGQSLRSIGAYGVPEHYVEQYNTIDLTSTAPAAIVARTQKAIWVENEDQFRAFDPKLYEQARDLDRAWAFAALPVRVGSDLVGVAGFSFAGEHAFSADERQFLQTFVDAAGLALERAQLYIGEAQAHQKAEAAVRAKDEFLAMLGHELRNPLAPIVTALDLMKLRAGGQLAREPEIIERHVTHLRSLVDDLLDIARITRGAVTLRREPVRVAEAIQQAVESTSKLIEDRGHQLEIDVGPGIHVDADRGRFVQVITNLVANAAKYTPTGGKITVAARREGASCVVTVRDTGSGIAPTLLPKIFDLFVQGERGFDRREGGLGLGLAIVKSLVTMHGGKVSASSEGVGRGAEFVVKWPVAQPTAVVPQHPTQVAPEALRILVVDDNLDAAELLAEMFRRRGHEVLAAHDGPSALARLDTFTPHIAVLDIGLPVMDGYELCKYLRAMPQLAGTRIVALTGYGQPSDAARARTAGFDHHYVKPLTAAQIAEILARDA
jgi:signal transduction histidine kinase/CheY-like chemotaxis protein